MDPRFEMDAHGRFRISIEGHWSEWVGYQNIAQLWHKGALYIGVSQYFEGTPPCLSPERVYRVAMV